MKPTLLTLLLLMAVGCENYPYLKSPLIVTRTCSEKGKNDLYYTQINYAMPIYTDSLYQVGDTIK
jgi:hypothetical protein